MFGLTIAEAMLSPDAAAAASFVVGPDAVAAVLTLCSLELQLLKVGAASNDDAFGMCVMALRRVPERRPRTRCPGAAGHRSSLDHATAAGCISKVPAVQLAA